MEPDILVVDDDRKTVELIKLYLERERYRVRVAYDGREALDRAQEREPDLVILDLMLPQVDGLDVCHRLRLSSRVPIIMLTARSTEDDKLLGLDTGADDYITKPFSPRELMARVRAVLRRAGEERQNRGTLEFDSLTIDLARHQARMNGQPVRLTPKEFSLLRALATQPGRAFSRSDLVERAFGFDYEGLERTVDVHVANLRKKIEPDPSNPRYVVTVPGVGYLFQAEKRGS